jgi:hypothetical protein
VPTTSIGRVLVPAEGFAAGKVGLTQKMQLARKVLIPGRKVVAAESSRRSSPSKGRIIGKVLIRVARTQGTRMQGPPQVDALLSVVLSVRRVPNRLEGCPLTTLAVFTERPLARVVLVTKFLAEHIGGHPAKLVRPVSHPAGSCSRNPQMEPETLKLFMKGKALIPVDDVRRVLRTWVVELIRRVSCPVLPKCIGKGLIRAELPTGKSKANST